MADKKYRILSDTNIEGVIYKGPGILVCDEALGKPHDGVSLDGHKDAIAYCEEQNMKAQTHKATVVDVTIDDIVEAIGLLEEDNESHWTKGGKPEVKALEEILGKDITAAQRDAAFDKFQAE